MRRKLSFFGHTTRDGECELVKCVIQWKVNWKRRRGTPKPSYSSNIDNWYLKAWNKFRWIHRIALDVDDWYDVWHGRLIVTPDGTAKEEVSSAFQKGYRKNTVSTIIPAKTAPKDYTTRSFYNLTMTHPR